MQRENFADDMGAIGNITIVATSITNIGGHVFDIHFLPGDLPVDHIFSRSHTASPVADRYGGSMTLMTLAQLGNSLQDSKMDSNTLGLCRL